MYNRSNHVIDRANRDPKMMTVDQIVERWGASSAHNILSYCADHVTTSFRIGQTIYELMLETVIDVPEYVPNFVLVGEAQ